MKQRLIFRIIGITLALTLTLLFASCTAFFEIEGREEITDFSETKPEKQSDTFVQFNNEANGYGVDVFSSYDKAIRIASVSPYETAGRQKWRATSIAYDFYLNYYVPIAGYNIPYVPADPRASTVSAAIDDDIINTVYIPNLKTFVPIDRPLFDDVFLAVTNTFTSTIRVVRNTTILYNVNGTTERDTEIRRGETALYRFSAGVNISNVVILVQGVYIPIDPVNGLPPVDGLPYEAFLGGYRYDVICDGFTAELPTYRQITLGSL